jgi:hypothetical protein
MIEESGLLVPTAILPVQYWQRRTLTEPWHRLMLAILVDAVRCYQRNFHSSALKDRRDFREAQEWLFSDADSGPFAYQAICHALGVDTDYLRERLRQWGFERTDDAPATYRSRRPSSPTSKRRHAIAVSFSPMRPHRFGSGPQ